MRRAGVVDSARGLGPHDHVCWSYDDPAEFVARSVEFLAEGLELGQRVCYVGAGSVEGLIGDLAGLPGGGEALRDGSLQVMSLDERYRTTEAVVPAQQVRAYAEATEAALADGFGGLRVAADVTALVRSAAQLDAFCAYEPLVNRYTATRPYSALCGYDRRELGADVIAELACLHPVASAGASPFWLYAESDDSMVLGGELDFRGRELLPAALGRTRPRPGGDLVVDVADLTFTDHHGLFTLSDFARRDGGSLTLRGLRSGPARLLGLLGIADVRVEARR
ncbi:MEDS domain-containing protein [Umezawaea tangerina]|uniref:DcmR-like sensory protein n=1 Tax=Umezawaea tangerina TaxID=84725 RepID=A0A2T0SZE4_9PSEU|nr:MEDS domain-containing protein [Umezawaea tangerina]PRY38777.1 DcmR-like sensory protein [Umezawaea tangerina]